jgi:hypothetical protein
MARIAVPEHEQAAPAIENKTAAQPYPPSWIDRLTDWVERLPGPAWLYYLAVALVLALVRAIAAWIDGSYPVGTFFPVHVLNAGSSLYMLLALHYLDDRAAAALADFRPVLNVDDAGYERLRYQFTTMPVRPVLVWSIIGLVFGVANQPLLFTETQIQSLKMYTSPLATVVDVGTAGLSWMVNAIFAYHTIRQLRLVSRTYIQNTNVNIFETAPLYALSRVTAITAIAVLFITYLYGAIWNNWQFQTAADASVAIAFVLVAFATFVLPLLGAHRLLQEEKARRKSEVARQMQAVTDDLHHRTSARDYSDMAGINDAIDSLTKEQSALDKVSTWPWEPETMRAVVTALLLPVVLWAITRVLERLGF